MKSEIFRDPSRWFSVVLFISPDEVEKHRGEFEKLGKQRNLTLVVQPCPFEGIEFLTRVAHDLLGHHVSIDKEVFWHAIEVKLETDKEIRSTISKQHHKYLCSILEQNVKEVEKALRALDRFSEHYPI